MVVMVMSGIDDCIVIIVIVVIIQYSISIELCEGIINLCELLLVQV